MSGISATSAGSSASEPVSSGGAVSSGTTTSGGAVVTSGGTTTSSGGSVSSASSPAYNYVVRSPFGEYAPGTMITNGATITALEANGQITHCVRIAAPTSSGAA